MQGDTLYLPTEWEHISQSQASLNRISAVLDCFPAAHLELYACSALSQASSVQGDALTRVFVDFVVDDSE